MTQVPSKKPRMNKNILTGNNNLTSFISDFVSAGLTKRYNLKNKYGAVHIAATKNPVAKDKLIN